MPARFAWSNKSLMILIYALNPAPTEMIVFCVHFLPPFDLIGAAQISAVPNFLHAVSPDPLYSDG